MEAAELARWTRFAAKGGIGKCIATADCVAESLDDLMFLKDDEITVLLQCADQEDAYLGYCEGVVGRFQGHDVYFQSKLKKPVMTKRASVSASSSKSPTPGLKTISDSRSEARSQRLTPASALESPVLSTGLKSPPDSPSRLHSSSDSFSTSTRRPPVDVSRNPPTDDASHSNSASLTIPDPSSSSGLKTIVQSSSTTDKENQLNSSMSFSSSSTASDSALNTPATPILAISSPPKKIPIPLNLSDANITPLRITKRSPLSPPSSPPANSPVYQSLSPPSSPPAGQPPHQPLSPLSSTPFPDSSYSVLREESDRVSLALSDGEVGIGLSLLQDLANGLREGNGDDDEEDKWSRSSGSSSVELRRHQQSKSDGEDDTVEELNYARDDDDTDSDEDQEAHNQVVSSFPAPPTSLSPSSPSFTSISPTSPTFSSVRRPSLAPSATSTGSWEGAADIYDDYRYSRFSIASKMSRFSSSHGNTSSPGFDAVPPPIPDSRPSIDSQRGRGTISDRKTSVDSQASLYTQASRSSSLAKEIPINVSPSTNNTSPSLTPTPTQNHRPASLDLLQPENSPLLHTNWNSSSPSPGVTATTATSSAALYTPHPGTVNADGLGIMGLAIPGSPTTTSGMASAMRQRIDAERRSPLVSPVTSSFPQDQQLSSVGEVSMGSRIVFDDEEELPSQILEGGSSVIEDSPSSSPEPDLMLQSRLAPLIIANRTPSPAFVEEEEKRKREHLDAEEEEENKDTFDVNPEPPSPLVPSEPPISQPTPSPSPPVASASQSQISNTPSTAPPPSHRPPSLRDLREGGIQIPGTNQRRSLFLPHPNAPKPPAEASSSPGPMFIAAQQPQPQQVPQTRAQSTVRPTSIGVIKMALSSIPRPGPAVSALVRGQGQGALVMRGPTIYGRTEGDLASAIGPVPILWSVEPLPPSPQPQSQPLQQQQQQQFLSNGLGQRVMQGMRRPATAPTNEPMNAPAVTQAGASGAPVSGEGGSGGGGGAVLATNQKAPGGVIPRPNFFPKGPGLRPRSRSFSGFNSQTKNPEVAPPVQRSFGRDDASMKGGIKPSTSSPSLGATTPSTSLSPIPNGKPTAKTSPLRPSPLSLPRNTITGGGLRPGAAASGALKSPSSPLAQSVTVPYARSPSPTLLPSSPTHDGASGPIGRGLRHLTSRTTLNEPLSPRKDRERSGLITKPSRDFGPSAPLGAGTPPSQPPPPPQGPSSLKSPPQNQSQSTQIGGTSPVPPPSSSTQDVTDAASIHSSRSHTSPPPGSLGRQPSLRTKLSLPNLRRNRSRQDSLGSLHHAADQEMLQVQDMEFELVRPNFSQLQAARASEDSNVLGRENSLDLRQDGFLRADSPAVSVGSGGGVSGHRSPTVDGPSLSPSFNNISAVPPRPATDAESSMDAHRQRESKWMTLMSTSPPAQARKSKKVRKLLLEGVPSSVRYLVWIHLTDGKARCVPGVYSQLCSRGGVPASGEIQKDMGSRFFQDQPHLQGTQGPVLSLLQAYFNMVPDIQYSRGLTLIVGQLLLLAPEEDAFWIFISIMDTHLRPYFSSLTTQMEVDSALFSRALEVNDPAIGKKILVDMGMNPTSICAPWFSSLFVGTLPPEYLNRVWDLFLYEGVPFLIRIGLALISCLRRQILESTNDEAVLHMLHHMSPLALPPSPDNFIAFTLSIKLKDDDIRKQRVKMEAQIKRQTQAPRLPSAGSISLPRS